MMMMMMIAASFPVKKKKNPAKWRTLLRGKHISIQVLHDPQWKHLMRANKSHWTTDVPKHIASMLRTDMHDLSNGAGRLVLIEWFFFFFFFGKLKIKWPKKKEKLQ